MGISEHNEHDVHDACDVHVHPEHNMLGIARHCEGHEHWSTVSGMGKAAGCTEPPKPLTNAAQIGS